MTRRKNTCSAKPDPLKLAGSVVQGVSGAVQAALTTCRPELVELALKLVPRADELRPDLLPALQADLTVALGALQVVLEKLERYEAERRALVAAYHRRNGDETAKDPMWCVQELVKQLRLDVASFVASAFNNVETALSEELEAAMAPVDAASLQRPKARQPESHEPGCDLNYGGALCSCSPYNEER